jgi:hypothetical protein
MKQLALIILPLLFLSACTLPFQNVNKCPDITLDLSKKTKDWIAPIKAQAGDSIEFMNTSGEIRRLGVNTQSFNVIKFPEKDCRIQVIENITTYSGGYNPFSYTTSSLCIIAMTQNISILPSNSFCNMELLNTFNTQDETITNRNGLLNYVIINDFEFNGEKLKTLNGQFSLSSDNCISNIYTNIKEFWITQKYGLIQFKDTYNVIWTRKM